MSLASFFKAKKAKGGKVSNDLDNTQQKISSKNTNQKDDGCDADKETSTNGKDTNSTNDLATDNATSSSSFTFDFFQNRSNTQSNGHKTQSETTGAVSNFQFQFDLNNNDIHGKKAKKNKRKKKKKKTPNDNKNKNSSTEVCSGGIENASNGTIINGTTLGSTTNINDDQKKIDTTSIEGDLSGGTSTSKRYELQSNEESNNKNKSDDIPHQSTKVKKKKKKRSKRKKSTTKDETSSTQQVELESNSSCRDNLPKQPLPSEHDNFDESNDNEDSSDSDNYVELEMSAMASFINSSKDLISDVAVSNANKTTKSPSNERQASSKQSETIPTPKENKKYVKKERIETNESQKATNVAAAAAAAAIKTRNNSKKAKKKPTSIQRQAQLNSIHEKQSLTPKNSKRRTKKDEKVLKFNSSDKGKAMVNHGSLAVHKEKSKMLKRKQLTQIDCDVGKGGDDEAMVQGEISSPFSFGFNFGTLLPQADERS